jgi:hypothetical protein
MPILCAQHYGILSIPNVLWRSVIRKRRTFAGRAVPAVPETAVERSETVPCNAESAAGLSLTNFVSNLRAFSFQKSPLS